MKDLKVHCEEKGGKVFCEIEEKDGEGYIEINTSPDKEVWEGTLNDEMVNRIVGRKMIDREVELIR